METSVNRIFQPYFMKNIPKFSQNYPKIDNKPNIIVGKMEVTKARISPDPKLIHCVCTMI